MTPSPRSVRPGMSLLEVLAALAILLLAIVAISGLMILGGQHAEQVRFEEEAVQIAEAKLAEFVAGALPLESQGDTPLDEDPSWSWAVDCEAGSVENLWNVTVRVSRPGPDGTPIDYCTLSQMILDPAQRGSTQDAVTMASSSTTDPNATGQTTNNQQGQTTSPTTSTPSSGSPSQTST